MGIAFEIFVIRHFQMKKVLIADDEITILSGLSKALYQLCDFRGSVNTVVNGRETVREIGRCFYDICFLDIKLPDINGINVMRDINEISPETNVILMSAGYLQNDLTGENGKTFYYIDKPFNFSQIKSIIKQTLEGDNDFYEKEESGRKELIKGRRNFKRKLLIKTFSFSKKDINFTEFEGCIINISYGGIGVMTNHLLEPGHMLSFNKGIGHKMGIVKWCRREMNYYHYRIGIKFL